MNIQFRFLSVTALLVICSVIGFAQAGNAVQFSNSFQVVEISNSSTLGVTDSLTVEAWIKADNLVKNFPMFVCKGVNVSYFLSQNDDIVGTRPIFRLIGGGPQATGTTNMVTGIWYHLAGTYDGATIKIYVNGVLEGSHAYTGPIGNDGQPVRFGKSGAGNEFSGIIDEVRIWDVARTQPQIVAAMNQQLTGLEYGLAGYWRLDEGTGTTTSDLSGNGHTGTLIGGTAWVSSTAPLPVELVSFIASTNQLNAELKWKTASETNNYGFEVEREAIRVSSLEFGEHNTNPKIQNSNQAWTRVGFVEGNGTTNALKEYSFSDKNLSTGKYSYRLKQIDRDGKFAYSQTVEVEIGSLPNEFALMQNYPNPFNPSTVIIYQIPMSSNVSLKVFDAIGREVATLVNEVKDAGYYSATFDASKLSSGIYFYRLNTGITTQTKKMMLIK